MDAGLRQAPPAVRLRLAESPFNLCAACVSIEVYRIARRPNLNTYLTVIEAIERKLRLNPEPEQ
jgi:hypothetical protein